MNRYKNFCIRQGSKAQCSPGAVVLGVIAVAAVVCYVYRQLIINTLIDIGIAVGVICGITLAVVITLNALRYRALRAPVRAQMAAEHAAQMEALNDEVAPTEQDIADIYGTVVHTSEVGEELTLNYDPTDKPVPAGLDRELDEDLLNLTGK